MPAPPASPAFQTPTVPTASPSPPAPYGCCSVIHIDMYCSWVSGGDIVTVRGVYTQCIQNTKCKIPLLSCMTLNISYGFLPWTRRSLTFSDKYIVYNSIYKYFLKRRRRRNTIKRAIIVLYDIHKTKGILTDMYVRINDNGRIPILNEATLCST